MCKEGDCQANGRYMVQQLTSYWTLILVCYPYGVKILNKTCNLDPKKILGKQIFVNTSYRSISR